MRRRGALRAAVAAVAIALTGVVTPVVMAQPASADPVSDLHLIPLPWPQGAIDGITPRLPDPTVPYLGGYNAVCPEGTRDCYQGLQNDLAPVENSLACNRKAVFNDAYMTITQRGLDYGLTSFYDPKKDRLYHQATEYGRQYLSQLDLYQQGRYSEMVQAWYQAYKAADAKTNTGTGDILMQLEAHILYDNPKRSIEQGLDVLRGPGPMPGSSGRDLHEKVNILLQDSLPDMLDHLAAVYDPTMDDSSTLLGTLMDARSMYFLTIQNWREWSWRVAESMRKIRAQYGPESNQYKNGWKYVDQVATNTVLATKALTLETVLPGQQTREQYCAAHFVPVDTTAGARPYWMTTVRTPTGG